MAAATLVASLLLTVCRVATPSARFGVLATAFVPWAVPGYVVTAALAVALAPRAAGRRRALLGATAVAAAAGALFHAAVLVPLFVADDPTDRPDLVVMSANLRLGQADAATVAELVRREHVDLLVLEEVTPGEAVALAGAGLRDLLPNVVGQPGLGAVGTVVLSRFPLTSVTELRTDNVSFRMVVGAPRPFTLVAVHPSQPLRHDGAWGRDWSLLGSTIGSLRGPRLVVGDLNAVLDHGPVRAALGTGLSDAAEQAGSGWQPTWPSGAEGYRLPFGLGLFAIDHVLASADFVAASTSTYDVPGSDHKALVARLVSRRTLDTR